MHAVAVPRTIEDLTPEWLTVALREANVLHEGRVVGVTATPIGAESGMTSEVFGLQLVYGSDEPDAPSSLVAKLASRDAEFRSRVARVLGFYEREVRFYRELAGNVPLRVPRCYHANMDPGEGWLVLLLEDLRHAREGDDERGCSTEDAVAALRAIAPLHATYWESSSLATRPWIESQEAQTARLAARAREAFDRYVAHMGAHLPRDMQTLLLSIVEAAAHGRLVPRTPHTLIHNDFTSKNLFFADGPAGPSVIVFDWGGLMRGSPAHDAAAFINLSLVPERLRLDGDRLLHCYHDALCEADVRDYPFSDLLDDYRRVTMQRLLRSINILGAGEPTPLRLTTARRMKERFRVVLEGFDPMPLLA